MMVYKPKSFDEYLIGFDESVQIRLVEIKNVILTKFPEAQESIRYNMPAYMVNGVHVYFSAYKKHIGMYPLYGNSDFEKVILPYRGKNTKDALHFLHSMPLPLDLIMKIVVYMFNQK